MFLKVLSAAAVSLLLVGASANAATVDFDGASPQGGGGYVEDGLSFDDVRIVNGNCDSASGRPCMALNDNEVTTITRVGGGTFTIQRFWFQLLGNGTPNTLLVTSNLGGNVPLPVSTYDHNDGGQVFTLTGLANFSNVTWLRFSTGNGGNVRIDDIVSEVPLPATGLLLLGGLGGLAAVRKRRNS